MTGSSSTTRGSGGAPFSGARFWDGRFAAGPSFDYDVSWLAEYAEAFRAEGRSRVLELGCGDGKCAALLHAAGFEVTATDISPEAVAIVQEGCPGVAAEVVDMSRPLPFPDCSFDVVLSNLSMHYFTMEGTVAVCREVRRVLVPGGPFLVRVNDEREYRLNKQQDTERMLSPGYVLSRNGKRKRYFDEAMLCRALAPLEVERVRPVSLWCNGAEKYALEALARRAV